MGIICCYYSKVPKSDVDITNKKCLNDKLNMEKIIIYKEKGYIQKIQIEKNKNNKRNYIKFDDIATASKSNDLESSNNNMKNDCDNDIIKPNNIQINENYEGNIESNNNNKSKNLNEEKIEKNIYFSLGVSNNNEIKIENNNNQNNSKIDNDKNNKNGYNINNNEKNDDNFQDNKINNNNLSNDKNTYKTINLENNNKPVDKDSPKGNNSSYIIIDEDEDNNSN